MNGIVEEQVSLGGRSMKGGRERCSLGFFFAGLAVLAIVAAACGGGGEEGDRSPEPQTAEEGVMSKVAQCQRTGEKSFDGPPEMIIDPERTYTATIRTEKGDVVLELFAKDTPITTNNFVFLACKGFYDGLTFHRVIPGFMAQGGDPTGTGAGGPGYTIPDEPDTVSFDSPGLLSMAKAGPAGDGGQDRVHHHRREVA
jgi:hypothetical protein